MAEYIGKKMTDNEVMDLFPKDYILMRYESDSIEDRYGEILWIGKDGKEMNRQLNLADASDTPGRHGIVLGSWFYENSLGGIF